MPKKTTSIKIDSEVWKKVKMHCIEKDIDISEYLEKIIRRDLQLGKK